MSFHIVNTKLRWVLESDRPTSGDALAIPANDHLWMGSGPGLDLKKSLGKEYELEVVRQGPVEIGSVVASPGATSGFRTLYHVVVTGQDLRWVDGVAAQAIPALFDRAAHEKVSLLVLFPLFRGMHGDRTSCSREMFEALLQHLENGSSVREVQVIAADPAERSLFQDLFLQVLRAA